MKRGRRFHFGVNCSLKHKEKGYQMYLPPVNKHVSCFTSVYTSVKKQSLPLRLVSQIDPLATSLTFHIYLHSQSEQQLPYTTGDGQYPTTPVPMATLPMHPVLLEHFLPRGLEPTQARGVEQREAVRPRQPYSEGEESDVGERSEGELVVLTD